MKYDYFLDPLLFRGFPCGSAGKNPPAMWETCVQSLGLEDSLEEGMATWRSMAILAWRIPMDRGAWHATGHEITESDTTEQLSTAHT